MHLAELIVDEMRERGWSRAELAYRMEPDAPTKRYAINLLALELFLEVRCPNIRLGVQAKQFARAFGIDEQFFHNVHQTWRNNHGTCTQRCCRSKGITCLTPVDQESTPHAE